MPIFDTVPRGQYEQAVARAERAEKLYDELLAKYHALRPTQSPVSPMRVTLPQPDSGEQALRAAEAAVHSPKIRAIAANLMEMKPGIGEAAALREAKRLDDIARGKAIAPSAGGANAPGAS